MYLCACIWVLRVNVLLGTSTISLYYKFDSLWSLGEQRTKSKSSTVWLFQLLLWPANYFCKKKTTKKQFSCGLPFQDNIQKRGKKRLGTYFSASYFSKLHLSQCTHCSTDLATSTKKRTSGIYMKQTQKCESSYMSGAGTVRFHLDPCLYRDPHPQREDFMHKFPALGLRKCCPNVCTVLS